jgi:hypothetical protein
LYKHALLAQRSSKRGDAADAIVIFLFIFFGQLMCDINVCERVPALGQQGKLFWTLPRGARAML